MKKLLFSSLIAGSLLTGCSAVYQTEQTPDDVYFSPGREAAAEVRRNKDDEERYQEYVTTMDDRYLRMRVANRDRWNTIDNFSYWNDMRYDFSPYNFNTFNSGFGFNNWGMQLNPWNIGWGPNYGFNAWNNWYGGIGGGWNNGLWGNHLGWGSPLYSVVTYANPKAIPATYTSGSNLNAFRNRTYNNSNYGSKGNEWYTPGNSGNNNFGSLVRRVFSAPNSSNGNQGSSFDRAARTFTNSSSSTPSTSSSAGGSSGGFKSTGSSSSSGRGGRN